MISDPHKPRKRKVELHDGWWFTCDECGRDNFLRAIITETIIPKLGSVEVYDVPQRVECRHCEAKFRVRDKQ